MWYPLILLKRWIEDIIIFPFVWLGRKRAADLLPRRSYDIYFFFPFYHTGGAEKVHSLITKAFADKKALIIFTRHSQNDAFFKAFQSSGHDMLDISAYTDNKKQYWNNLIYRGIVSGYIHAQKTPTLIFQGHSNFAYKLSRWIRKDIPQIELIHSYNSFSQIRLPFISFYAQTVMISKRRIENHIAQYRRLGVPKDFDARIVYIQNAIELPAEKINRTFGERLRLMYVGRSTSEKRVHLAAAIANKARAVGLNIDMSFVGDVATELTAENKKHDRLLGNISNPNTLYQAYREFADVILIPSTTEGLPMVMMEAMAHGSIVMATPVGDIPYHIQQGINGYLFSSVEDEQKIIEDAIEYLRALIDNDALKKKISDQNLEQAFSQYGLPSFEQDYRTLIQTYLP